MGFDIDTDKATCHRCGRTFPKRRGYFKVSYAGCHKGVGFLPICIGCVDNIYSTYLAQCGSAKDAVRQTCRKLDLFWSDQLFNAVESKSTQQNAMSAYLQRLTSSNYAGKSYDDTLINDGTMWSFRGVTDKPVQPEDDDDDDIYVSEIDKDVIAFWGSGYTPDMYNDLEQRRSYWMSRFPDDVELDIGTEAIIRQICSLELDINRDRAAGRSVEKSINALNTLLGSANLKPTQKKDDDNGSVDNTPFGVWIKRWEDQRPIPDPDPALKDVDGIIRYIEIWFKGHLSKMLGFKNAYSQMYQDEIDKMRVERPEYEGDDDEELFNDVFGGGDMDE